MKITVEFDPGEMQPTEEADATMPEPAAEAEAEATPAPKPEPMPAPTPKAQAQPKPKPQPVAEAPAEPAPKGSSDFANMGGISNISDPQKSNPNVFHFVAPREE